MILLLHATPPSFVMGSGVLRVRLLEGAGISHAGVLNTENKKLAASQPPEISAGERQSLADVGQSAPQGVNGYLPVSALSERPKLLKDIDPEWYLYGLDLPSLSAVLLINEYGDVDDLIIDTTTLTPMLLQDLRIRFCAARFLPGRIDRQPVKVALHVVIQLE
jgi:hypothetical protein